MLQLNTVAIQESIAGVGLGHMTAEIDLGDIILHDGDQSAEGVAIWLIQRFFWDHPIHKGNGMPTKNALQDALDQAKYMSTNYLVNEWESLGERAKIFMLSDAHATGWHTNRYYNYQNLEELLSSILDEQSTKGGISIWTFIVRQLLPAAARYGIDPALLYGAKAQSGKLRQLIPAARKILNDESMSESMKEKHLKYLIEHAADKTVSYRKFQKDVDKIRNKEERKIQPLVGYECIMPNQETWIVIRCPRTFDERVVEMLLGQKVDLKVTDWRAFSVLLASMMKDFGDLSVEDRQNLVPKLMSILEGRRNGHETQAPEGTAIQWSAA